MCCSIFSIIFAISCISGLSSTKADKIEIKPHISLASSLLFTCKNTSYRFQTWVTIVNLPRISSWNKTGAITFPVPLWKWFRIDSDVYIINIVILSSKIKFTSLIMTRTVPGKICKQCAVCGMYIFGRGLKNILLRNSSLSGSRKLLLLLLVSSHNLDLLFMKVEFSWKKEN